MTPKQLAEIEACGVYLRMYDKMESDEMKTVILIKALAHYLGGLE